MDFALDPKRQAILLAGGDKSGANQRRLNKRLIAMADDRYDDHLASLPQERLQRIDARAMELATLKDLRQAAQQTQEQLAATLGVGQDTISRLEKRSDMLLSTLRHYVESMGGRLNLVAQFPNRPPLVIEHLGVQQPVASRKSSPRRPRAPA